MFLCCNKSPETSYDINIVYLLKSIERHWVPLTTSKKMQKNLPIVSVCSLQLNFFTLLSMFLMQSNLLVKLVARHRIHC